MQSYESATTDVVGLWTEMLIWVMWLDVYIYINVLGCDMHSLASNQQFLNKTG